MKNDRIKTNYTTFDITNHITLDVTNREKVVDLCGFRHSPCSEL